MSFTDATEFWNARFNKEEFIFGKEPNAYLVKQAQQYLSPGMQTLCVADGEGRNSVWLAKQGMQVFGFDVSDIAISKAKQFAAENSVQVDYSLSNTDEFYWQANTYDAVIAIFIQFADPEMRTRILSQIERSLKSGGILILQGYTPKQLEYKTGGPAAIEHLYTAEMLRAAMTHYEILDLCTYEQVLSEGARHSGMSALLGLTARKL